VSGGGYISGEEGRECDSENRLDIEGKEEGERKFSL